MSTYEFLKTYKLTLKTIGPVFVGSGSVYSKSEYIFNPRSLMFSPINSGKLFKMIADRKMEDQFEKTVLSKNPDMYSFFKNTCCLSNTEINALTLYSADASDALDERHSLKAIQSFVRNGNNEVYIPGSSLKGMLRTAILFDFISNDNSKNQPQSDWLKKGSIPENKYLNKLSLDTRRSDNMVNSIMRGISVSDSKPVSDKNMILCRKIDLLIEPDRRNMYEKEPNVVRECIRPETEIEFALTLDDSVLHGAITKDSILENIKNFSSYYYKNYVCKFPEMDDEFYVDVYNSFPLYIGGGAGYFSKTLTYPYFGKEKALNLVSKHMSNSFKKHGHNKDTDIGISPHTLKYTEYKGKRYQFGMCEVSIE